MSNNDDIGNGGEWKHRWYDLLQKDLKEIKDEVSVVREQANCTRLESTKAMGNMKVDLNDSIGRVRSDLTSSLHDTKLELTKSIDEVKSEITGLKVKAGIWGTIGASIPAALVVLSQFWFK